jgi:flagellar P-ring protein FlgI
MSQFLTCFLALLLMLQPVFAAEVRIKDMTSIQGIRDNQLVGYGLVIGLAGTGDTFRKSPFTETSMRSMLERMGVGLGQLSLQPKNVAAVVVTATLPPFVRQGTTIDVTVSSLGDATSLSGGTLVMTPLVAANREVFAVAQGPVVANGIAIQGDAASVTKGVPTTGRVAEGAIVERDHSADLNNIPSFTLQLRNPDFATVSKIADAINAFSKEKYKEPIALELDHRSIEVMRPKSVTASRLMAEIGLLKVAADTPARIVIDERNGTIVMGENVRISPVAVSHGNLTIRVTEQPIVHVPEPLSGGETVVTPSTNIEVQDPSGPVAVLRGPTLEQLVKGLNTMGLRPSDITSILQSIKAAGALQAELVIQ